MADDLIEIGVVHSVNPARRELRVTPHAPHAHEFGRLEWVSLQTPGGEPVRRRVASVRTTGQAPILTLVPGVPKDAVAALKGARVCVRSDELSGPEAGWFDVEELAGLEARTCSGRVLGRIVDAFETPANGVAEIERPDGSRFLLALAPEAVHGFERGIRLETVDDFELFAVEQEVKDGGNRA